MLSRFNFRSSSIPAKGVDTSFKSLSSREVLCAPQQGRFLVRCEHSGQACDQSRAGKHGLSVLMPLVHPNLKQGVAYNRNYSIGFQMTSMYLEWKLPHPPIPRFWADDGMTQECMKISCCGSWRTKTWRSRSSPEKQQTGAEDQNFCAALKQEPHSKLQIIDSLTVKIKHPDHVHYLWIKSRSIFNRCAVPTNSASGFPLHCQPPSIHGPTKHRL